MTNAPRIGENEMGKCQVTFFVAAVLVAALATSSQAELKTTNEFGVTVTPDELVSGIYEHQEFWPAVHKHILSSDFNAADEKTRKQVVDFFKRVDSTLRKRLFGDEAQAEDLLTYLAARIRNFRMLRQVRDIIKNDSVFWALMVVWEDGRRAINQLEVERQPKASAALLNDIKQRMQNAELSDECITDAMQVWNTIGQNRDRINQTGVGRLIIGFEAQVRSSDSDFRDVVKRVKRAADWAMIKKQKNDKNLKVDNFIDAWQECCRYAKTIK